jgi:signal transduction histidine kinase
MLTQVIRQPIPFRLWNRWVTPQESDRDKAFRENTIRVTSGLLIGVMGLAIIIQIGWFSKSVTNGPFLSLLIPAFILSCGSAFSVHRKYLVTAGWLLTLDLLLVSLGLALINGIASNTVIPTVIVSLIMATLVLPRTTLLPLCVIALFGMFAIYVLQGYIPAPLLSMTNNGTFTITSAIFLIPLATICLRQLRVESDNRLTSLATSLHETEEAKQEAEHATKAKSQFLANMSHELRTPLNAIIGYTEIMLGGMAGVFTDEQRRLHTNIERSAKRLLGLINDILDLSRIEVGRIELRPKPLSPKELVTDLVGTMQSIATKKNLTLTLIIGDDAPATVVNDVNRLQQVIVNLLGNALKFTKQGGVEVYVNNLTDDRWEIKVCDTGIGISTEALPKIFDIFEQADVTDTRPFEGTGLGLAIVKTLVEHMNGTVTVQSTLSVGSTFTVTLPQNITIA